MCGHLTAHAEDIAVPPCVWVAIGMVYLFVNNSLRGSVTLEKFAMVFLKY